MRHTSQIAIIGAIVAIGAAIARNNGEFDAVGLILLALALVFAATAALNARIPAIEQHGDKLVSWTAAIAIVIESLLFSFQPIFSAAMPRWTVIAMALVVSTSALLAIFGRLLAGKAVVWLLVGSVFVFGILIVHGHSSFVVDVRLFQHVGSQALLQGDDPYIIRFPNIYSRPFYGAANVGPDGFLKAGFIYPPLVAILGIPGVLLGDVRFSHVLAMAGAAAALGFARANRMAIGALAMFALMPRTVYFLAGGWTEALSISLLCWTVWATVREAPKTTGVLAGLLIASKQYLIVIAPLLLLAGDRRNRLRIVVTALLAATLVTLPFAMRHPPQFFNSVIGFHLRQPFRTDSLSFLAAIARGTGVEPARLVGVIVVIVVSVISMGLAARLPRTPPAFALSVGFIVLLLFAFSQQAFINYYAFAYAALCAALATSAPKGTDRPARRNETCTG